MTPLREAIDNREVMISQRDVSPKNVKTKYDLAPELRRVTKILDSLAFPWAIYAGAAARVYGCERPVRDVDILVPGECKIAVSLTFHRTFGEQHLDFHTCKVRAKTMKLEKIEISTDPRITLSKRTYYFRLDSLMAKRVRRVRLFSVKVPVVSVEDNIVFKLLLQRGFDDRKFDLQDAKVMLFKNRIDLGYLMKRSEIIGATPRIVSGLKRALVQPPP